MIQYTLRRRVHRRVLVLRRCIKHVMDRIITCCLGKPVHYRMLPISVMTPPSSSIASTPDVDTPVPAVRRRKSLTVSSGRESVDSNLVSLKISLLGDSQIGKTSFLVKYVGDDDEKAEGEPQTSGLNFMDKTLRVRDARISYSIWEVGVDRKSQDNLHVACKDSVAILFMFDLTSRVTLNSIPTWYNRARKWNQTAIPILIGTKFDDFIQLPLDLQWAIASQARAYAKALNATLFFSSATYNINVNKIFKFITAKLFDLPWTVERNLTIGEPIIDF